MRAVRPVALGGEGQFGKVAHLVQVNGPGLGGKGAQAEGNQQQKGNPCSDGGIENYLIRHERPFAKR
jgi:hypothetical protein